MTEWGDTAGRVKGDRVQPYVHVRVDVHVFVSVYVCMHVCAFIYIYIYIYATPPPKPTESLVLGL